MLTVTAIGAKKEDAVVTISTKKHRPKIQDGIHFARD